MNKICVGLDLDHNTPLKKYFNIINETKEFAFCYKINPAFFLNKTKKIEKLSDYLNSEELLWIYDGKLGDVNHTNEQYAKLIYEEYKAWGTTLNPYMGFKSLEPFLKYKDKNNFILCRTTNKGSELLQKDCYKKVYNHANLKNLGLVVAANKENYLTEAIENCPNSLILSPGIGPQGGTIKLNNTNIIYNSSRSIINSKNPKETLKRLYEQSN